MCNKIKKMLIELGVCDKNSIVPFYPKVRDRNDVSVLKCNKSNVILLSRSDHIDISHYSQKNKLEYWGTKDRYAAIELGRDDIQRRSKQFNNIITGKRWMDVGTGAGGILDAFASSAQEVAAVEPQDFMRNCLIDFGYNVFSRITEAQNDYFEVISLFHVLEHFTNPLGTLLEIKSKMVRGGKIIIEIPHANDILLSLFDIAEFKSFTFWSEHLILHTRKSIELLLLKAGFSNVSVNGCQRYPLANHLYWLDKSKPGGHNKWSFLRSSKLDLEYEKVLDELDKTDTLIVIAEKIDKC